MIQVAGLTFADHRRLLWAVVAYAAVFAVLGPWTADLALGAPTRALRDLGLGLGWLVASGCAIGLGIGAFGARLRAGTPVWLLSGPLSRRSWWLGTALGGLALLALLVVGLTLAYGAVEARHGTPPVEALAAWAALLWAECAVLLALAALLGALARPPAAAAFALALWAAGHLASEHAAATAQAPWTSRLLFTLVPDLDRLVVHGAIVHGDPVAISTVLTGGAHAALWTAALLALGVFVMEHTDPV